MIILRLKFHLLISQLLPLKPNTITINSVNTKSVVLASEKKKKEKTNKQTNFTTGKCKIK